MRTVAHLARMGGEKKAKRHYRPREAAQTRLELRLAPLEIRVDKPLQLRQEAAPIHHYALVRDTEAEDAEAPPALTAEEPATAEELSRARENQNGGTPKRGGQVPHPYWGRARARSVDRQRPIRARDVKKRFNSGSRARSGDRQRPLRARDVKKRFNSGFIMASMILLSLALVGGVSAVGLLRPAKRPALTHDWRAIQEGFKLTLTVTVRNLGSTMAEGIKVHAAFDSGENISRYSEESDAFDLDIGDEITLKLILGVPKHKYKRFFVEILDHEGHVADVSYSKWFQTG